MHTEDEPMRAPAKRTPATQSSEEQRRIVEHVRNLRRLGAWRARKAAHAARAQ